MSVMQVVLQRNLRRSRQLLRVAVACSPTARILAWEVFTACFPAGERAPAAPVGHGDRAPGSLVALVGPGSDAGLGQCVDDAVGTRGPNVVDGAWQGRRGPEQASERIRDDLDVHAMAFVLA